MRVMRACACAFARAGVHACTHVCVCVRVRACMYMCARTCVCACLLMVVWMLGCVHVRTHLRASEVRTCTRVCVHGRIFVCLRVHLHTQACVQVCVRMCARAGVRACTSEIVLVPFLFLHHLRPETFIGVGLHALRATLLILKLWCFCICC